MKLQVFQGGGGWYVRAVARNGETMVVSEAYVSRSNALRAARRLRIAVALSRIEVVNG